MPSLVTGCPLLIVGVLSNTRASCFSLISLDSVLFNACNALQVPPLLTAAVLPSVGSGSIVPVGSICDIACHTPPLVTGLRLFCVGITSKLSKFCFSSSACSVAVDSSFTAAYTPLLLTGFVLPLVGVGSMSISGVTPAIALAIPSLVTGF